MRNTKVQERKKSTGKSRSLTGKIVLITIVCCIIFEVTALALGLSFYGLALVDEYASQAFDIANSASISVTHTVDCPAMAKEIMDIYSGLSEKNRQLAGTGEYEAFFSQIVNKREETYHKLFTILSHMIDQYEVADIYLAMYDSATNALVYIYDPDTVYPMHPGDWESVDEKEVRKFLNWDGSGNLYDISYMKKYGWLCTAGIPILDEQGEICMFLLTDMVIIDIITGMLRYAIGILLCVAAATILITWRLAVRLKRNLADPISAISAAAAAYVQDRKSGVSSTKRFSSVEIHSGDELENLSHVLIDMEQDLKDHEKKVTRIAAEKERINTELNMARIIQESQLPNVFPPFPEHREFDVYASMAPAREVGGDFFDIFRVDDSHICMVIADVAGKGIPAALFMMISKILIKNRVQSLDSPGAALANVNNQLLENAETNMFVTVWLCIFDYSTGKGIAANAGHEHPVLRRAGGQFELVKYRHSPAVGTFPDISFKEHEFRLDPGDSFFVYTDGVAEATNDKDELFGTGRLLAALNESTETRPEKILKNVRTAVNRFAGNTEQFDDLTMLCLSYWGNLENTSG